MYIYIIIIIYITEGYILLTSLRCWVRGQGNYCLLKLVDSDLNALQLLSWSKTTHSASEFAFMKHNDCQ